MTAPDVGYLMLEDALQRPELLEPPPNVVPRLAWEGRLTGLGSDPKAGKSTLLGQAAAALVQGIPFLDEPLAAARVVWLGLDEAPADYVRRLAGFGAQRGVALVAHRPRFDQLETIIRDLDAKLLVVDTVTELAVGLVEDGNSGHQWAPIYSGLRGILQRTGCAGVLLDHTGKANPHSLVGSIQKMAGCDVVLTMTTPDKATPNIRHIQARGRIYCPDFSLCWDGERNTLHTGELSLETRVYHAVVASPGISTTRVRSAVGGKAGAVDTALKALAYRRMIEDRGGAGGHQFYVVSKNDGTGPGQGWDRPPLESLSAVGQGGTGLGQGLGQAPLSPPSTRVWGTGVSQPAISDEEMDRETYLAALDAEVQANAKATP